MAGDPDIYVAGRHHIGLGLEPDGEYEGFDWLYGFITTGPSQKTLAAPAFETPSNAGANDLIGARTHSVWTQSDYTGGEFQDDFADEAMFAECQLMIPSQLTRTLRTVRPVIPVNLDDIGEGNVTPVDLSIVDDAIFVLWNSTGPDRAHLYRYNIVNPTGSGVQPEDIPSGDIPSGHSATCAAWNGEGTRIWVGSDTGKVFVYSYNSAALHGSRITKTKELNKPNYPDDPVVSARALHLFGKLRFLVTGHGDADLDDNHVWLYVSGNGADTKWTHLGALPGQVVKTITYNNAVYFLTRKGNYRTQLSMSQGDEVFPVLDLPYAFRGMDMIEYAGRLYISGAGYDLAGTEQAGELYEVSGTSLRLVRTFSTEAYRPIVLVDGTVGNTPPIHPHPGQPGKQPKRRRRPLRRLASLAVQEGLLWMPDESWGGFEAYDATTDGFFGGTASRGVIDEDDDYEVFFTKIAAFGSGLIAWGTSPIAVLQGIYRLEQFNEDGGSFNPFVVTSDFHPEPGRQKMWSQLVTLTRNVEPVVYASADSGDTWTALEQLDSAEYGDRWETTWDVAAAIDASRTIRFKIEFPMEGSELEAPAELIAHSLSFLVLGDNKRRWTFTVNAGLEVEGLSGLDNTPGDDVEQEPINVTAKLWELKGATQPVYFRDVDGSDYQVIISDLSRTIPVLTSQLEAYVAVTLTEV